MGISQLRRGCDPHLPPGRVAGGGGSRHRLGAISPPLLWLHPARELQSITGGGELVARDSDRHAGAELLLVLFLDGSLPFAS